MEFSWSLSFALKRWQERCRPAARNYRERLRWAVEGR